MIQANELRRGNILAYNGGGLCEVFAIEGDSVGVIDDIDPTYESLINLHYVPLTEDILLKCGFEKYDTDKAINYKLGGFRFSYVNDGKFKGKTYLTYGNVLSFTSHRAMEYLHSFQNLYWSLCQQELEIKL